jgi:trk system potassium uptake protein TrkH
MRIGVVLHLTGLILRVFSLMFTGPLLVALYYGDRRGAWAFFWSGLATAVIGQGMARVSAPPDDLRRLEGMVVVAGVWLLAACAAAPPFVAAGLGPIDALFESMSGLTTTGATVIRDFSQFGRAIYLWRAVTHWVGGLGIIALFVAVLPRLAIAGRQLFFAEAPGPTDEKLTPQIRKTAAALWKVYTALTAAEIIALVAVGMPVFDAVCNAFATLAAGGLSPNPQSIMGYRNAAAEWIITLFMFAAGANFALHYRSSRGELRAFERDEEFRTYLGIVLVATLLLVWLLGPDAGDLTDRVRIAAFQVVSIITTTGFASVDFQLWSDQAKVVLLVLMFVGGCAGSTAGGPKVVRQLLIARYTRMELRRIIHPRGVLPVKLGGRVVPDDVMRSVLVFLLFYLLVFAVCTAIVVALGADIVTGLSAAIATLGNIGPGFNAVGPMSHFGDLHPASKVVLTAAMWIGRLEVLTVLAVLRPEVWRSARWRGDGPT